MGIDRNKRLKVWLIKNAETPPGIGNGRMARVGMLAGGLSAKGHDVTWWTTTFQHGKKEFIFHEYTELDVNEHEKAIMLHVKHGYKKNVSLGRIRYNNLLAKEFSRRCEQREEPDIIFCAWPTMELAREAVRYGERHHVPVVVDIRDLWPDIFVRAFPGPVRCAAPLALLPLKRAAARTIRKAAGLTAVTPAALAWGCRYAGREPGALDRYIPIGNDPVQLSEQALAENISWWRERGVTKDTWNICFFGGLGRSLDIEAAIRAVMMLGEKYPDIRFVIGGKGDREEYFRSVAGDSPNIVFAGWLDRDQMNSAMTLSKCGMYCLINSEDFRDTFSNKAIQYLSGGLPVITSLTGFASTYLREQQMGYTYREGDAESCAEMIEKLILDEPARRAMGDRALRQFNEHYDSHIVNGQFEDYFYEVLDAYSAQ